MPDEVKFEDWTPPWGADDEKLDIDKVKKLIFGHTQDKAKLQASNASLTKERDEANQKVKDFETKDLSEVDRLKRENEELKSKSAAPADDLRADRLEVALEKGLTAAQARRLSGSTREELEADADSYIEEHGIGKGDGEGEGPPSNRPRGRLTTGLGGNDEAPDELDPAKLGDQLPPRRF